VRHHHTVIDADEEAYTVERLTKMKTDHEQRSTVLPADRIASGTQLLINQSVNAINQSGGITAHTVNIYTSELSAPSPQLSSRQPPSFPKAAHKDGPARFRSLGDPIGIRDDPFFIAAGTENSISLATGPAMWLRLMPPHDTGRRWTSYDLKTILGHGLALQPFLWGSLIGGVRLQTSCGGWHRLLLADVR
jgi:hypothetical protein